MAHPLDAPVGALTYHSLTASIKLEFLNTHKSLPKKLQKIPSEPTFYFNYTIAPVNDICLVFCFCFGVEKRKNFSRLNSLTIGNFVVV